MPAQWWRAFTGQGWKSPPSAAEPEELESEVRDFHKALALVEANFADKVSPDKTIYKGAIPGMLRTLDPHSNFFDAREYQLMREEQKGHYYGVGMQVGPQPNGKTAVKAPFPASPAYKVGIRPGDILVSVNDKSTEGLNTTEIADLLKGPRGTPVKIVVSREGVPDYVTFTVIRDEISRKSVQDAFWIKPGYAYLKIIELWRNHRAGDGREPEAAGREQYRGPGAGSARQPGRAAESGRRCGRPFPAEERR